MRRQIARAAERPSVMRAIANAQKSPSLKTSGDAMSVAQPPMMRSHAPTVSRWKMPQRSSTVVWSVRSSSRS